MEEKQKITQEVTKEVAAPAVEQVESVESEKILLEIKDCLEKLQASLVEKKDMLGYASGDVINSYNPQVGDPKPAMDIIEEPGNTYNYNEMVPPTDISDEIDEVITLIRNILELIEYFFEVIEDGIIDKNEIQGLKFRLALASKTYDILSERYFPDDMNNEQTKILFQTLISMVETLEPTPTPDKTAPDQPAMPMPESLAPAAPVAPAAPAAAPAPAGAPVQASADVKLEGKADEQSFEWADKLGLPDELLIGMMDLSKHMAGAARRTTDAAFGDPDKRAEHRRKLKVEKEEADKKKGEEDKHVAELNSKGAMLAKEIFRSQLPIMNKTQKIRKYGVTEEHAEPLRRATASFKAARDAFKCRAMDDPELEHGVKVKGPDYYFENAEKSIEAGLEHKKYASMIEKFVDDIDTSKGVNVKDDHRLAELAASHKHFMQGKALLESIKCNDEVPKKTV